MMPLCPICKKPLGPTQDRLDLNRFFPFCSERCKLIDLGRWLGEKYGIPVARPSRSFDPPERQNPPAE